MAKKLAAVTDKDVLAYLEKNAPDIAAIVKNATVGDVHRSTALTGKTKPKPPATFADQLARMRSGKTEDEPAAKGATVPWEIPLEVVKAAPDQQLVFGWASIAEKDGKLIIDKQNDVIYPEDLEAAAYNFVLHSRVGGDMHERTGTSRLVESMVFTKEKQDILKVDLGLVGWWTGWRVDSPGMWAAYKRGERPEFSIGGRGRRVTV